MGSKRERRGAGGRGRTGDRPAAGATSVQGEEGDRPLPSTGWAADDMVRMMVIVPERFWDLCPLPDLGPAPLAYRI